MQYTPEQYRRMDQALFSDCSEREVFFRLLKEYGGTLPPEFQNSFKVGVDIGSVSGFYLAAFLGLGMKAIGINSDPKAIQYVREEAVYSPYVDYGLGKDLQIRKATMNALPLKNDSVDLITVMTGTFSHVERGKHESALEECARVLGKERLLIISDWNIACGGQNFLGLYTEAEQEELRANHFGYPLLLETLQKLNLTPRIACLHSEKKMYAVLVTRD